MQESAPAPASSVEYVIEPALEPAEGTYMLLPDGQISHLVNGEFHPVSVEHPVTLQQDEIGEPDKGDAAVLETGNVTIG